MQQQIMNDSSAEQQQETSINHTIMQKQNYRKIFTQK